jgi:glutamyl-tRNA(Gln) amidotransferase subunit D
VCEKTVIKSGFDENIALIWAHPGFNSEDWENITSSKKGVVIAGTGLGHINSNLLESIGKTAKDMPVAMSTQCLAGTTNLNVYRNGRELIEKGVVETHDTLPETALVKMMWLTKHEPNNVEKLMSENLVGELSSSRKLI